MVRTLPSDNYMLPTLKLLGHIVEAPGRCPDDLFCYLLSNHSYKACVSGKHVANQTLFSYPMTAMI